LQPLEQPKAVYRMFMRNASKCCKFLHWLHWTAISAQSCRRGIPLFKVRGLVLNFRRTICNKPIIIMIHQIADSPSQAATAEMGAQFSSRVAPKALYLMRISSLGVSSTYVEILRSLIDEKSGAEIVYLLQQPAYDCSLASLSGNQLSRPSSRPPCPINGKSFIQEMGQIAE
jgi:hypothetical protein